MKHQFAGHLIRVQKVLLFTVVATTMLTTHSAIAQGPPPSVGMAAPFDPHDLSGYWELGSDSQSISPAVLLPSITKAKLDKMRDADLISARWCRPLGYPAMMDTRRPMEITQGKFEVLVTAEANVVPRHIYYRAEHINPDIYDPSSTGDSAAHWDGDTLVVDVIGFHPKNGRMMIPGGGFRTEKSHVVERYKLLKNGNMLSVSFTWTDPTVFKTPHTYEFRYTRIPGKFEPLPAIGCDPYDDERTEFVERTFSPELKKEAEAALVKPGTAVPAK